ncbi:hypothetical protein GDO78_007371 [Eleutherodactylus coqui]|uniref:Uncharacterized protein n=1 Tax=Eleutherodactylus coqui TaxID=57060 RepID=A0A8J6FH30_ELECQ|nr:hypothetical protein GDO78_007371 [Eleutherodactylus coqui]
MVLIGGLVFSKLLNSKAPFSRYVMHCKNGSQTVYRVKVMQCIRLPRSIRTIRTTTLAGVKAGSKDENKVEALNTLQHSGSCVCIYSFRTYITGPEFKHP